MEVANVMAKAANDFYNELCNDCNGRYRSWEYCYYNFYKARLADKVDIDYLSLQLAFYLASWGMYRGSSFLLQKDYKVHIPAVEKILESKYDVLFGIESEDLLKEDIRILLFELINSLSNYYKQIRDTVKGQDVKKDISMTLITKILMGTLGCVPAYDRYFISGVKITKVSTGNFTEKSIVQIAQYYIDNKDIFENVRKKLCLNDILYPPMKLMDMGFWLFGLEYDKYSRI